jgi:transaldolase
MQLFLDTTDVAVLKDLAMTGLVDGVTTNPTLIAKSGRPMLQVIAEICAAVEGPVSAEVAAMDTAGMLDEGRKLASIAPNVVVKLPLTRDGLIACREFAHEGIATNVTLCFSAAQALLAAKAGASYISPFIGRLDDHGADGMDRRNPRDLRQLRFRHRDPRRLDPQPRARDHRRAGRRRLRDHPAGRVQRPLQAPVNRTGS